MKQPFLFMKKIVIAGGTGFIGSKLTAFLSEYYEIIVLTRNINHVNEKRINNIRFVYWDGKNLGEWTNEIENAEAVINLSGTSIDCRFTHKNKHEIIQSRIDSTHAIGQAISLILNPPSVWINFSAVGYYSDNKTLPHDEFSSDSGTDFLSEVAKMWENAFAAYKFPQTRKICLRISLVLDKKSKIIQILLPLIRMGLGGKVGNGKQIISWIHIHDLCRLIFWLLKNTKTHGVYNACSPYPVTNEEFMSAFRKSTKSTFGIPAPVWIIKLATYILNKDPSLILNSVNVIPKRLINEGFEFIYPKLDLCLQQIINENIENPS